MTLVNKVEDALASMDVEGATQDKLLGDDLEMDSQELLCATLELERLFSVKIEDGELVRDMTLLDLATMISRKISANTALGQFDYTLVEDTTIEAPFEATFEALVDVDTWPEKLPHVRSIVKRYDDGLFQEFDMEVEDGNGGVISVHSVRRCEPGWIRFFQPTPPKFMRHHCGDWILRALSDELTHVLTRHQWRLSDVAEELFPPQDDLSTGERVQNWLAEHARFALKCWKSHLEQGVGP